MQGLYNDDLALQNATAAQARAYVEWYLSRDRAHAQSKSPVVVARVNTICVLGKGDQSCEPGRISRARFLVSIKTGQTPWSKVMCPAFHRHDHILFSCVQTAPSANLYTDRLTIEWSAQYFHYALNRVNRHALG